MIHALLYGKLSREQENMEDILTSNVFGLMRYLPFNQGVIPFLKKSVPFVGECAHLFEYLSDDVDVEYEFWPRWSEPGCRACEPDLVLRIQAGARLCLICIEAKFRSGKSSMTDSEQGEHENNSGDQLVREWENLWRITKREKRHDAFLIYLTADYGKPIWDMNASASAAKDDRFGRSLYWLSWRHLTHLFPFNTSSHVLNDLNAMVNRMGFFFFEGIHAYPLPSYTWQFLMPKVEYSWVNGLEAITMKWRFDNGIRR